METNAIAEKYRWSDSTVDKSNDAHGYKSIDMTANKWQTISANSAKSSFRKSGRKKMTVHVKHFSVSLNIKKPVFFFFKKKKKKQETSERVIWSLKPMHFDFWCLLHTFIFTVFILIYLLLLCSLCPIWSYWFIDSIIEFTLCQLNLDIDNNWLPN